METHQIKCNTVYVDGDLIHTVSGGETTLDMVEEFFKLVDRVLGEKGRVFLLTDASKSIAITSDARRFIAEWSKTKQLTAVANVVTSPVTRAALTLATRAMSLLGQPTPRTLFVGSEAEARRWLDEQREDYFRKNPSAPR
jgi:hypothetical protein